jgi:hypothetical protein
MEIATALRSEIEKIPQRPDGIDVSRVLAGIRISIAHFRAKTVAHHALLEGEYIQHRSLFALGVLTVVVDILAVGCRRK